MGDGFAVGTHAEGNDGVGVEHGMFDSALGVAEAFRGGERLLAETFDRIEVATHRRVSGRGGERVRIHGMVRRLFQGQDPERKSEREAPGCEEAEGEVDVGSVDRLRHRQVEILGLGLEPLACSELAGTTDFLGQSLVQVGVVLGVAIAQRLGLCVFGEALLGVLADGFQQPVSRVRAIVFGDHETALHEFGQQPEHRPRRKWLTPADPLGGFPRASAHEHRDPGEEALLRFSQQVIGPVNGCPQRLLTFHGAPPCTGEHLEAVIECRRRSARTHHMQPRRGEFDGQRDPIQATTDLHHRPCVGSGQRERGVDGASAVHEQRHRGQTSPQCPRRRRRAAQAATAHRECVRPGSSALRGWW